MITTVRNARAERGFTPKDRFKLYVRAEDPRDAKFFQAYAYLLIDLARLIIARTGSKSVIRYTERRSWDHSVRRQADISRARETLQFRPSVPVEEGITRTVEWFVQNREVIGREAGIYA